MPEFGEYLAKHRRQDFTQDARATSSSATPWAVRSSCPTSRCWRRCKPNWRRTTISSRRCSNWWRPARSFAISAAGISHPSRFKPEPHRGSKNDRRTKISRRVLLKGLGVSVALPWLESVPRVGERIGRRSRRRRSASPACSSATASRRRTGGRRARAPTWNWAPAWSRWRRSRRRSTSSTACSTRRATAATPAAPATFCPAPPCSAAARSSGGVSMDQLLAKHFEEETAAAEPGAGLRAAGQRLPREPVLDGLRLAHFLAERRTRRSRSSCIRRWPSTACSAARRASCRAASSTTCWNRRTTCAARSAAPTRQKLDEYLSSVRETEQRVQRLNKLAKDDAPAVPASQRPPAGQPKDFREYARLMCDIIALAFQTDRTRIATLLLSRDLSGQVYPFLGIRDDHHSYSHANTGPAVPVDRQVPRRAVRLPARQAGEDAGRRAARCSTTRASCSSRNTGTPTTAQQVPLVLAGGLGGTLQTGRTLDYLNAGNDKRQAVQPVPVDHGPHGPGAAGVRRRQGAAGGYLTSS